MNKVCWDGNDDVNNKHYAVLYYRFSASKNTPTLINKSDSSPLVLNEK